MNMPTRHYLQQNGRARAHVSQADVILGLEVADFWGIVNAYIDVPQSRSQRIAPTEARLISIGLPTQTKSNYQDLFRLQEIDLAISGQAEATLPYLLEEVRRQLGDGATSRAARGDQLKQAARDIWSHDRQLAALGWDATPISVARMCAELGDALKGVDWGLISMDTFQNFWPHRLWDFSRHYQFIGGSGGAGIGYIASAGIGAALAHRDAGRIAVGIGGDGDFMCCPQAIWTAAHHSIPLLYVVHNNRAYNQETMHVQRMASRHSRGVDRAHIGTVIDRPAIDFAKLAESQGVRGFGPVTDPGQLRQTFSRALEVVRGGQPAVVDVVSQPR
jgi:thiamine pyrophosphate-dependent acetolactate synthase large subunit-like protein